MKPAQESVELSDERDERDAFAWDHLPAQQNWTCVLDTGATKAPVGRTTYEKYKGFVSKTAPRLKFVDEPGKTKFAVAEATIAEAQYRGVSRRQQYRGGNDTAEATVSRSLEWTRGISVTAAGGRAGEYRRLHDPELSCHHAAPGAWRAEPGDPDLIAGSDVRPQAKWVISWIRGHTEGGSGD